MGVFGQLGLLLRKQTLLKRRQPVILGLEVIWPLLFLAGIVVLRYSIPPVQKSVCHYNARAMPSSGLLPFLQSFICNIDNKCLQEHEYEDLPKYKNARLKQIVQGLDPLLNDAKLTDAMASLPKSKRLIQALESTIGNPSIKEILEYGLQIKDLISDPEELKKYLTTDIKVISPEVADALLNSTLKVEKIFGLFGNVNIKEIVCQPDKLSLYLRINTKGMVNNVSQSLCAVDKAIIPKIARKFQELLNFRRLFQKAMQLMEGLGDFTMKEAFDDLFSMLNVIKNLSSLRNLTSVIPNETFTKLIPSVFDFILSIRNGQLDVNFLKVMLNDFRQLLKFSNDTESRLNPVFDLINLLINIISEDKFVYPGNNVTLADLFEDNDKLVSLLVAHSNKSSAFYTENLLSKLKPQKVYYIQNQTNVAVYKAICDFPMITKLFYDDSEPNLTVVQNVMCSIAADQVVDTMKVDFTFVHPVIPGSRLTSLRNHIFTLIERYEKNVTNLIKNILPVPKSWMHVSYVIHASEKVLDMLTMYTPEEPNEISFKASYLVKSLTDIIEIILNSAGSPVKVAKMSTSNYMEEMLCDDFSSNFIVPSHIDAAKISSLLCKLYKDYKNIITAHQTDTDGAYIKRVLIKGTDFIHTVNYIVKNVNEFRKFKDRLQKTWQRFLTSPTAPFLLNVKFLEFLDLTFDGYTWWKLVKQKVYAFDYLLDYTNSVLSSIRVHSQLKMSALTADVHMLNQLCVDIFEEIPNFINAVTSVFNGGLYDLMAEFKRFHNHHFEDYFCYTRGFAKFLKSSTPERVMRIESVFCNRSEELKENLFKHPLIIFFQHLISGEESNTQVYWSQFMSKLTKLDENLKYVLDVNVKYLPDVNGFPRDIGTAIKDLKNKFNFPTSDSLVRFFLGDITDHILRFWLTIDYPSGKHPTYAEEWNMSRGKTYYKQIPHFGVAAKFFLYAQQIVGRDVSKFLQTFPGKTVTMTDIIPAGPLHDFGMIVSNLPNALDILISVVRHPELLNNFLDVVMDSRLHQLCYDKQINESLSSKNYTSGPLQLSDLRFLFCVFPSAVKEMSADEFLNQHSKIPFFETYNFLKKVWYHSEEKASFSTLQTYENIVSLDAVIHDLIRDPPSLNFSIFDASQWTKFADKYFSSVDDIQRLVVADVIDNLLVMAINATYIEDHLGYNFTTFDAMWHTVTQNHYAVPLLSRGVIYTIKYGLFSVRTVFSDLSEYLHSISGKRLNLVDLLPRQFEANILELVSDLPEVLKLFIQVYLDPTLSLQLPKIQAELSKGFCNNETILANFLNRYGSYKRISSSLHSIICSDVHKMSNLSFWHTTIGRNPVSEIYLKLRNEWYDGHPVHSKVKVFDIIQSYKELNYVLNDLAKNPPVLTLSDSFKALTNETTWDTVLDAWRHEAQKYSGKLVLAALLQLQPSISHLYETAPVFRRYINIFNRVLIYIDDFLTKYHGQSLNITDLFEQRQELTKLVSLANDRLPEIAVMLVYQMKPKFQETLISKNPIKVLCSRPVSDFFSQPINSTIDVENIRSRFCNIDFNSIVKELKHEFGLENISSAPVVNISEMLNRTDKIIMFSSLHFYIELNSTLFSKARWNIFVHHNHDWREFPKKIMSLIEPVIRHFANVTTDVHELRSFLNLAHYMLIVTRDSLKGLTYLDSLQHDYHIYFNHTQSLRFNKVVFSLINITRSAIYTIFYPKQITDFVDAIVTAPEPFRWFCNMSLNEYFYAPDAAAVDSLSAVQEFVCHLNVTELTQEKIPVDFNKHYNLLKRLSQNAEFDVNELITDIYDLAEVVNSLVSVRVRVTSWNSTMVIPGNWIEMFKEFVKKFDDTFNFDSGIPQIVDDYMSALLPHLPQDTLVVKILNQVLPVLESVNKLSSEINGNKSVDLTYFVSFNPELKNVVRILEDHVVDIVRVLLYTSSYAPEKLVELFQSPNYMHEFCNASSDEYMKLPPSANISLSTLQSKLCSINITLVIGGSKKANMSNHFDSVRLSKLLLSTIQNIVKHHSQIKLNSNLFNESKWKEVISDFTQTRMPKLSVLLSQHLKTVEKYSERIPKLKIYLQSLDSAVVIANGVIEHLTDGDYNFNLGDITKTFKARPQLLRFYKLVVSSLDIANNLIYTFIDPQKVSRIMSELVGTNDVYSQFCSSSDIDSYFEHPDVAKAVREFACNFSYTEMLDELLSVNVTDIYNEAVAKLRKNESIDVESLLQNIDVLQMKLSSLINRSLNYTFKTASDLKSFELENWSSLFRSIYVSPKTVVHSVIEVFIGILKSQPNITFVRPLQNTIRSLDVELMQLKTAEDASFLFQRYPSLNKIIELAATKPKLFVKTLLFFMSRIKLQLINNPRKMMTEMCKGEITFFAKRQFDDDTMMKELCSLDVDQIFANVKALFVVDQWINMTPSSNPTFEMNMLNASIYHIVNHIFEIESMSKQLRNQLMNNWSDDRRRMSIYLAKFSIFVPIINYVVNVTSNTIEMKYFWEATTSSFAFSIDIYHFVMSFFDSNMRSHLLIPNYLSDDPQLLYVPLSPYEILDSTRILLDTIFDAEKVKVNLEEFFMSDHPFENFCNNSDVSHFLAINSVNDSYDSSSSSLVLCRYLNKPKPYQPFLDWIEDLKNGTVGKVDPHLLISNIDSFASGFHVNSFHSADLATVLSIKNWNNMFQKHLVNQFMSTFLDRQNATKYVLTIKDALNNLKTFPSYNIMLDQMMLVYGSVLNRFAPGAKTVEKIFKDTSVLGEVIALITDVQFLQPLINNFDSLSKLSSFVNGTFSDIACDDQLVHDLELSDQVANRFSNVQDILCRNPNIFVQDIYKVFKVFEIQKSLDDTSTNHKHWGDLLEQFKDLTFDTKDTMEALEQTPDPWIKRLKNLRMLNFDEIKSFFNNFNISTGILWASTIDKVLRSRNIAHPGGYVLDTILNSDVQGSLKYINFIDGYMSDKYSYEDLLQDRNFFRSLRKVSSGIKAELYKEQISLFLEQIIQHSDRVLSNCGDRYMGFHHKRLMSSVICRKPPSEWMKSVHNLLNKTSQRIILHSVTSMYFQLRLPKNSIKSHFNWTAVEQLIYRYREFFVKNKLGDYFTSAEKMKSVIVSMLTSKAYWLSAAEYMFEYIGENVCAVDITNPSAYNSKMAYYYKKVSDATHLILEVWKKTPDFEDYLCRLPNMNLTVAYNQLMHRLGVQNMMMRARNLFMLESSNRSVLCDSATNDAIEIVGQIEDYAQRHDSNAWLKIDACFNQIKTSPVVDQIDNYLRLLSGIDKLNSTKLNITTTLDKLRTDLDPLLSFVRDVIAPDPFVKIDEIMNRTTVNRVFGTSSDRYYGIGSYRRRGFTNSLINSYLNVKRFVDYNFTQSKLQPLLCDPKKLPAVLHLRSRYITSTEFASFFCRDDETVANFIKVVKDSKISSELPFLLDEKMTNVDWLAKVSTSVVGILKNTGELGKLTRIFNDLQHNWADTPISELISNVLQLVNQRNLAGVISHVRVLLHTLKPVLPSSGIVDDIDSVLKGLEGLKVVTGTIFGNVTYKVSDLFSDSSSMKRFLRNKVGLESSVADAIMNSSLVVNSIFDAKRPITKAMFCDPLELQKLLNLTDDSKVSIAEISRSLCRIPSSKLEEILEGLLKHLNVEKIAEKYMKLSVDRILGDADLEASDIPKVMKSLNALKKMIPDLRRRIQNITDDVNSNSEFKKLNVSFSDMSSVPASLALKAGGSLVCGKPLEVLKDKLVLIGDEGNSVSVKESELQSLPTEYCQNVYRQIIRLSGGPLIWGVLKPIIQGRVLYTPDTPTTRAIIKGTNVTFDTIGKYTEILRRWADGVSSIDYFREKKESLLKLKDVLQSDLMQRLLSSILKKNSDQNVGDDGDLISMFNLTSLLDQLGDVDKMASMVTVAANISECFNANRFHGYDTEDELISATRHYGVKGQFLAGIVFLNSSDDVVRTKRDTSLEFPQHVRYKIRMDVDSVHSTLHLQDRYWRPKAHDSFANDLRYQHGFIQLQDMVDRSIINYYNSSADLPRRSDIYSQQFPYPCFNRDEFGYYLKGMLPVIMTMAWLFLVAFLIRDKILERELHLEQVLRVMGLRPGVSFLSWFVLNFVVIAVIVVLIVLMVKLGRIVPFSDWTVLLIFLLEFSFSVLMFCYCVSVFFNTATIGALTGLILYLMFYLPFVVMIALEATVILPQKLLTSLLMSSAFSFGCLYIARFEDLGPGIQWDNIWSSPLPNDEMNFAYSLIMLAVDGFLYGIIGWYISSVFPAQKGVQGKRWYFMFQPSFWSICSSDHKYIIQDSVVALTSNYSQGSQRKVPELKNVGDVDNFHDMYGLSVGINISNLKVVYDAKSRNRKVAIHGLNLDLYENQITTLLGQNGAGKSTTLNVLTGQQLPTDGTAFISGINILSHFEKARKTIGYCPQHNILFDNLSIREHLEYYGKLKGLMSGSGLESDINSLIESMNLGRMQDEMVKNLSGGMKRRLCVALAFVGGSTTIILDEPTSGVDPVARRSIWDLITKNKKGRTILLTTHYMDEADILSDRVAIIHQGRLLCCGSSPHLKAKFGSGYLLSVESLTSPLDRENLNFSSDSFSAKTNGQHIQTFLQQRVSDIKLMEEFKNHSTYVIPYYNESGIRNNLQNLFVDLEKCSEDLGILTYDLKCTTLEEVFLKVCGRADAGISIDSSTPTPKNSPRSSNCSESDSGFGADGVPDVADLVNGDSWITGSRFNLGHTRRLSGASLKLQQFSALIYKRFWHTIRDWRIIFCSIILPCIFIATAMGFSLIRPKSGDQPSLMLTPSMYGPYTNSFIRFGNGGDVTNDPLKRVFESPGIGTSCMKPRPVGSRVDCIRSDKNFGIDYVDPYDPSLKMRKCRCLDNYPIQKCEGDYIGYVPPRFVANTTDILYDVSGHDVDNYLLLTQPDFIKKRYGGWSTDDEGFLKVWYNSKGYHSLPAYFNALSNSRLRSAVESLPDAEKYGITTYTHPVHVTSDQLIRETIAQRVAEIGISVIFLIGFCFIPSCFVIYVVKERMNEEKRLQYISGVGPIMYWTTAYVWDTLLVSLAVALSAVIIAAFGIPIYTAKLNLSATLLLLFMFGWSTTPLMYILEKFFREGSIASMVLYCANCFIATNIMVCIMILTLFQEMPNIEYVLNIAQKLFMIFPHYALGGGLLEISRNQIKAEIYHKFGHEAYENPFDFLRNNYVAMLIQGIVFFVINMLLEAHFLRCSRRQSDSGMPIFDPEDGDVQAERKRINGKDDSDLLKLVNLTKVYQSVVGKNVAVDKVCVGVKRGECFGLLGVNGAGKTTAFRMMTGDLKPTWGQVLIKNKIVSDVISNGSQLIGYCPQADALDELLTAEEIIKVYAMLRGIRCKDIKRVVFQVLNKFHLKSYASRVTRSYSGGTKRKLCTAVASIGNPEIILMDEPTSGMDPATRRLVWNNILSMVKDQKSVILTSHSMEECDILCARLAIMVNGRLKCIGSPQYLKNKFGDGYVVTLRYHYTDCGDIMRFFKRYFPNSSLKAHHNNMLEFNIPSQDTTLSEIFQYLESGIDKLDVIDFSVSQTSLDQVFVNFSRGQSDGILDYDEPSSPLDFGDVGEDGGEHVNAAYNNIYGVPENSSQGHNTNKLILDKSPNMYYGDESSTDRDFVITKL